MTVDEKLYQHFMGDNDMEKASIKRGTTVHRIGHDGFF
jgi:hypothetical protein